VALMDSAALWVPGPLPGMNEMIAAAKGSGGRGRAYSTMKRDLTAVVAGVATRAQIPRFAGRVLLDFRWYEPNRKRDCDNVAAARKFVLDGLVAAGVLKGDGWRYVQSWTDRFDVAGVDGQSRGPGVAVTIWDVG
jgi:hypothetical protein